MKIESHTEYANTVWIGDGLRIIRCKDDLQYVLQEWRGGRWRGKSYFLSWQSLQHRHPHLNLPQMAPDSACKPGETAFKPFDDTMYLVALNSPLTTEIAHA